LRQIAIIGGGISGLSAAHSLDKHKRAGADLGYVVYEAAPRLGGVLVTERVDGCLVEAGPDSFLTEKPWALELCREIGLGDQIIGSNDAQRKTYIVVRNRLLEMPDGLMFMVPTKILPTVLTPLFSWGTKLRMAREFLRRPPRRARAAPVPGSVNDGGGSLPDESVASFLARHFGREMVERLADPLLSGIYGADSDRLSVRAVLLRFVEMEQKYGSLSRGMLAARKRMAAMSKGKPKPPLFSSLREGMVQLVDALRARLDPQALRAPAAVTELRPCAVGWEVTSRGARERFDGLILATPAHVAARLLARADGGLAEELAAISYSSSVTISLLYDRAGLAGKDRGFGFLVPRSEGRRMLACTFVHNKFPHRAPADRGMVRCFLGGWRDAGALRLSDDEITGIVRRELREVTGITALPRATRIYRWERAMAQPTPAHLDRIARIEAHLQQWPNLALAGNYFRGIGVPDCVRSGREAAKRVGILR
jgi:oxygen-dependent protoporphyrinogen oxidase